MEPHPALIAIVDDDVSAREGISDLVSTVGFDVHAFASAEDFLLSPDLGRCVCLIVDMKLGAMSGLDLYDHLTAVGSSIPTIVITAFPDDQIRLRALAAGVVCYLRKPFVAQELLDCLRCALGRPPRAEF